MIDDDGQLLLPFEFVEEEKKIELPYFEEPKNDNEILLNLQHRYRHGDLGALGEIYERGVIICHKLINKEARKNKHIRALGENERIEKANDAVTYIIQQFLTKKEWHIKTSFTAYLFLRVQKELYNRRKCDEIVDFVDMEEFYKLQEKFYDRV